LMFHGTSMTETAIKIVICFLCFLSSPQIIVALVGIFWPGCSCGSSLLACIFCWSIR
jgi:hypothetical protein